MMDGMGGVSIPVKQGWDQQRSLVLHEVGAIPQGVYTYVGVFFFHIYVNSYDAAGASF